MKYLALETSTRNCSVAAFDGEELLSLVEESSDQYIHSEKLHLFIEKALQDASLDASELQGVAVGAGPGSYTGLRIGVAAAKALAYALNIPLISARGTELLVAGFLAEVKNPAVKVLKPMIDARRMEVYTANYDVEKKQWTEVEAVVVDESSWQEEAFYYFGDGAEKCQETLKRANQHFHSLKFPSAAHFKQIAPQKFEQGQQEDVAYFEPFYLKSFQAIKPKNLL